MQLLPQPTALPHAGDAASTGQTNLPVPYHCVDSPPCTAKRGKMAGFHSAHLRTVPPPTWPNSVSPVSRQHPSKSNSVGQIPGETYDGGNGATQALEVLRSASAGPSSICWPAGSSAVRAVHAAHRPSVDRWALARRPGGLRRGGVAWRVLEALIGVGIVVHPIGAVHQPAGRPAVRRPVPQAIRVAPQTAPGKKAW